jgi:hypothetical protein
MIPLLVPIGLGLIGGYLSQDSTETFAEGGEIDTKRIGVAKRIKVKNWYIKTYPTDDLGEEINENITFWSLWAYIYQNHDVYDVLGVGDSIIRERVFEKLSEILGIEYKVVYDKWLQSVERYVKGGGVYQDWEDVYYKDDRYKEWMNRLDKKTNKVIGQESIIYLPYQDVFRVYKKEYAKGGNA